MAIEGMSYPKEELKIIQQCAENVNLWETYKKLPPGIWAVDDKD